MAIFKDALYVHYKNSRTYLVMNKAINPNTGEEIVLYREWPELGAKMYDEGQIYWRSLVEFEEKFRRKV